MKIDSDAVVEDLNGNAVKDGDVDLKVAKLAEIACLRCGVGADGRPVDATEQSKRYKVARRVKRGNDIDLDDIATIKLCVAQVYANPLFTGFVSEYLDTLALADKAKDGQDEINEQRSRSKKPPKEAKEPD